MLLTRQRGANNAVLSQDDARILDDAPNLSQHVLHPRPSAPACPSACGERAVPAKNASAADVENGRGLSCEVLGGLTCKKARMKATASQGKQMLHVNTISAYLRDK